MTNVINNINQLVLGFICIPQFSEAIQDAARDLAQDLGISDWLNMPRCNTRNLLGKAVKAANRHNREYETIQVHEGLNRVQYVIVRKSVRESGQDLDGNVLRDPDLGVEARFYFDKEARNNHASSADCVKFFENENHPVAKYIKEEYFNMAVIFTGEDMRKSANNMLSFLGAVQITRGNVWFAPRQCEVEIQNLKTWLTNNNCHMASYTQLDIDETKASLQNACQDQLAMSLQGLKDMIDSHKADSKTRETTLEKRIEDLNRLRTTVDLYVNAIGCDLDDLKNEIIACEDNLVAFMTSKQA